MNRLIKFIDYFGGNRLFVVDFVIGLVIMFFGVILLLLLFAK